MTQPTALYTPLRFCAAVAMSAALVSASHSHTFEVTTSLPVLLSEQQSQFLFGKFMDKYGKKYETTQLLSKLATFKQNLEYIISHNSKNSSYTLAMNEFGDLSAEDFSSLMNLRIAEEHEDVRFASIQAPVAPSSLITDNYAVDWSEKVENPIKNQKGCGSCWAFSAVGSVEYRWAIHNRQDGVMNFSEQQVLDCDVLELGCSGGLISNALYYIQRSGGLCAALDYPYEGKVNQCREKQCPRMARPDKVKKVVGTEIDLVKEIRNGPVPVALAASPAAFQFYKSGILDDKECSKGAINHAIIAVGYAPAKGNEKAYIKIRNSWGAGWGENGYIRIAFNENVCGINTSTFFGSDYFPHYE